MTRCLLLHTLAVLALMAAPLDAQEPTQQAKADSLSAPPAAPIAIDQAQADGTMSAAKVGTGGWFTGGVVTGFVTGLIGTAIARAIAGRSNADLPPDTRLLIATQPITYQQAYEKSFAEKLKAKRKSSALRGGLIGSGAFAVLFLVGTATSQ